MCQVFRHTFVLTRVCARFAVQGPVHMQAGVLSGDAVQLRHLPREYVLPPESSCPPCMSSYHRFSARYFCQFAAQPVGVPNSVSQAPTPSPSVFVPRAITRLPMESVVHATQGWSAGSAGAMLPTGWARMDFAMPRLCLNGPLGSYVVGLSQTFANTGIEKRRTSSAFVGVLEHAHTAHAVVGGKHLFFLWFNKSAQGGLLGSYAGLLGQ